MLIKNIIHTENILKISIKKIVSVCLRIWYIKCGKPIISYFRHFSIAIQKIFFNYSQQSRANFLDTVSGLVYNVGKGELFAVEYSVLRGSLCFDPLTAYG